MRSAAVTGSIRSCYLESFVGHPEPFDYAQHKLREGSRRVEEILRVELRMTKLETG